MRVCRGAVGLAWWAALRVGVRWCVSTVSERPARRQRRERGARRDPIGVEKYLSWRKWHGERRYVRTNLNPLEILVSKSSQVKSCGIDGERERVACASRYPTCK